jgi:hypothetical protein
MLRCLSGIIGYRIGAMDGEIGKVRDFLVDDLNWTVRYVLVDGGLITGGRRVIISPAVIGQPNWNQQVLPAGVTKAELARSRSVDIHTPPSGQQHAFAAALNGLTPYWPPLAVSAAVKTAAAAVSDICGEPHLRSVARLIEYQIRALDGRIGRVDDFIADDEDWSIHYMTVATGNWLPGKRVLIEPRWIRSFSPDSKQVSLYVSREDVTSSPEYDPRAPVNRQYEARRYDYCGRPMQWE